LGNHPSLPCEYHIHLFFLGRLYSGDPPLIEKNESLQSKYIELAAQQGHQLANYTLGTRPPQSSLSSFPPPLSPSPPSFLLLTSLGCEYYYGNEFEIAYSHFEEALVGGDVGSHYYLGEMYFLGQGVVVDYNKALEHLLKAIPQKNTKPIAYHHIGKTGYHHLIPRPS
jgi:TPR repeat protein